MINGLIGFWPYDDEGVIDMRRCTYTEDDVKGQMRKTGIDHYIPQEAALPIIRALAGDSNTFALLHWSIVMAQPSFITSSNATQMRFSKQGLSGDFDIMITVRMLPLDVNYMLDLNADGTSQLRTWEVQVFVREAGYYDDMIQSFNDNALLHIKHGSA